MSSPPYAERYDLDAVYLSPHLDDVVLSCGGQLHRFVGLGQRVLVVTIMAGAPDGPPTPLARELHRIWGFADDEAVAARRDEDLAACAEIGVEALHLDFDDAVYRRRAGSDLPLYPDAGTLFSAPDPQDDGLVEALARRLADLPSAPRLVAPFGIGRHVDHQIVRRAAERFAAQDSARHLELYEDYPYCRKWWSRQRALGFPRRHTQRLVALDKGDARAKCRAVACYSSQLEALFGGRERMEKTVEMDLWADGGERLWW